MEELSGNLNCILLKDKTYSLHEGFIYVLRSGSSPLPSPSPQALRKFAANEHEARETGDEQVARTVRL